MSMEDLMEQMICERIEILMRERPKTSMEKNDEILRRQEKLLHNLEKEQRIAIEQMVDDLIAQVAEDNRYLYLAAIGDGIRLAKVVLKA